jgi:hypothetical protein
VASLSLLFAGCDNEMGGEASTGGAASALGGTSGATGGVPSSAGGLPNGTGGTSSTGGASIGGQTGASGGTAGNGPDCSPQGCPTGYDCNTQDTCAGGNPLSLPFDEQTVSVAGKLTLNGAPFTCTDTGKSAAVLGFYNSSSGAAYVANVFCDGTFPATVMPAGTYRVTVNSSNVPSLFTDYVLATSLALTTSNSSLVFDEQTVSVAGKLTLNGAPIT